MSSSGVTSNNLSDRKINTKTLCDLIGSRYYPYNEEIPFQETKVVKVYDENDQVLGEMTLREALLAA